MAGLAFDAKQVQANLIALGFLPKGADDGRWGKGSKHALTRFQRRAATVYRMSSQTGLPADCGAGEVYQCIVTGDVSPETLAEIKKWQDRKWKAPLGRFKFKAVSSGTLREDAAAEWTTLVTKVKGLGGTIDGPYGDTKRRLGKATKDGASSFSFHIVGRAIDLNEKLNDPRGQRYWVAKDLQSDGMFFRIYCKTDSQDGSQGKQFKKGDVTCWSFGDKKDVKLPEGYYLDLSAEIEATGKFERIHAHTGWESHYSRSEWWHHQFNVDKQDTFQDECELVGYSEKDLKAAGYSDHDLDRVPG